MTASHTLQSSLRHDDGLRPSAAELYKWSLKFQRQLDKLCSQHSSHVELLHMLANEGEGPLGTNSFGLCARHNVPLARAGGDAGGAFGFEIWDDDDDKVVNDEPPIIVNDGVRRQQDWSDTLPAAPQRSDPKLVAVHHALDRYCDEEDQEEGAAKEVDSAATVGEDVDFPMLLKESKETPDTDLEVAASEACRGEVAAHRLWTRDPLRRRPSVCSPLCTSPSGKQNEAESQEVAGAIRRGSTWAGRFFVLLPGSVQHLTHAIISLVVILYDIMSLPLTAAFMLEDNLVLYYMDLSACCFWSWDVVMNFLTGYNDGDHIEMRLSYIAKRYLKTWFPFDVMVIGFDWSTLLISDVRGLGLARSFKAPRFLRMFLRTLRLLRLVKMVLVLEDVLQCVVSEWIHSSIGVMKMLFGIIVFNHFVACGWHAVGVSGAKPSWMDGLGQEASSIFHRYMISFHWSMCQYTPAPNNYHPQNVYERLYACVTLLFGIAVFTAFLGKITSLLTHMSATAFARARDERAMRQYLATNMITMDVVNRINVFLKNRSPAKRVVPFNEVLHFKGLPKTLLLELKLQAHLPCLHWHAMLSYISGSPVHRPFLLKLCSRAIAEVGLKWGDELLNAGSPALQTIFVKHGTLHYASQVVVAHEPQIRNMHSTASTSSEVATAIPVGPGQNHMWACEMALWCQWTYRGHLRAMGESIALVVDVAAFHALVLANPPMFSELKKYAEVYVDSLNEAIQEDHDMGVDDLWGGPYQTDHMTEEAFGVRSSSRASTRRGANLGLTSLTLEVESRLVSSDGATPPTMVGKLAARLRKSTSWSERRAG